MNRRAVKSRFTPAGEHCFSRLTLNFSIPAALSSSNHYLTEETHQRLRTYLIPLVRAGVAMLLLRPWQELFLNEPIEGRTLPASYFGKGSSAGAD